MVDTYKKKFNRKYKQPLSQANGKADISRLTGIPVSILDSVFYKGVGAFKTNPQSVRPGMTKDSWGYSRVYSFVMKGAGTWGKADKHLADKVRKLRLKGYIR